MSKRQIEERVTQARDVLTALGLPVEQTNARAALTFLALVDLKPTATWTEARNPLIGVTPIMEFAAAHYGQRWAPNTRETIRRFTLHQFVQAGIAIPNPDHPDRATNSPHYCYQIAPKVLNAILSFGTPRWSRSLETLITELGSLARRYAHEREMRRIPLHLPKGKTLSVTPGGQNELIKKVIEEFCPRFTPKAIPLYIGDTAKKWAYFDDEGLHRLGTAVESHGKMPDVVVYYPDKNWLVLIEAVTSHGPINPKRLSELKTLFRGNRAGLVFVTAFLDRTGFHKYLSEIAWETEVWVATDPDHMIHFNGQRFLGPY